MSMYSLEQAPQEVRELVANARNGNLSPHDFCKELSRLGIKGPTKMFYVRDAFGLPLEKAKEIVIQFDYGSVDAWSEVMNSVIDEMSSELGDSKDAKKS